MAMGRVAKRGRGVPGLGGCVSRVQRRTGTVHKTVFVAVPVSQYGIRLKANAAVRLATRNHSEMGAQPKPFRNQNIVPIGCLFFLETLWPCPTYRELRLGSCDATLV